MEGDYKAEKHFGIIPRTVNTIFESIAQLETQKWNFSVKCCFQEIYLDQVRDLLDPKNSMTQLNKASSYEPTLVTVYNTEIENKKNAVDAIFILLKKARKNRVTSDNQLNSRSSRSHSIFQLFITSKISEPAQEVELNG